MLVMPERRNRLRMGYLRSDDVARVRWIKRSRVFQHDGIGPANDISETAFGVDFVVAASNYVAEG